MKYVLVSAAPSGPPQDVAAVPLSSTTVHVTWNDVLVDETNGVLTDYEVLAYIVRVPIYPSCTELTESSRK